AISPSAWPGSESGPTRFAREKQPAFTLTEQNGVVVEYAGGPENAAAIKQRASVYRANGMNALVVYPADLVGLAWEERLYERIEKAAEQARPSMPPTPRLFTFVIAPFKPSLLYLSNRRDRTHRAVASVPIEHRHAPVSMLSEPAACEVLSSGHHPAVPAIEPSTYR
ncbi:MAG TPA: hypothetical protein P5159_26370, partial [Phycisphaerae bacterium]|nr:hypothetical protein [Phycisphaerae bacterium]